MEQTDAGCRAPLAPGETRPEAAAIAVALTLAREEGAEPALSLEAAGAVEGAELVVGDSRLPFEQRRGTWRFAEQSVWSAFPTAGRFHVTVRLAGGRYASARYAATQVAAAIAALRDCARSGGRREEQRITTDPRVRRFVIWALAWLEGRRLHPDRVGTDLDTVRGEIEAFMRAEGLGRSRYLSEAALARLTAAAGFAVLPRYDAAGTFDGGIAAVKQGDLWGGIAPDGTLLFEPRFEDAGRSHRGYLAVKHKGRWGFVDHTGRFVHQPVFEETGRCGEGLCAVMRNGRWGFLRLGTGLAIKHLFDRVSGFREGFAAARANSTWQLVGRNRDTVSRFRLDRADRLYAPSDGVSLVIGERDGGRGYIRPDGTLVIGLDYEQGRSFSEGLAAVRRYGRWGYIDTRGKTRIKHRYKRAGDFRDGLAPVQSTGGDWGYIDTRGRWSIRPRFARAYGLSEGVGVVRIPDPMRSGEFARGFVLKNGRYLFEPIFEDVYRVVEGRAPVMLLGAWGFIDAEALRKRR